MDLQLTGRVAVITGASKGIGLAVAQTLADEGAHVITVSRTPPPLDALHVPADLMDPAAPDRVVERALAEFGRIDVVVNNAGGPPPGTAMPVFGFLGRSDEEWRAMLEFNLLATVRMCRAALPAMVERGDGAIVNVSSGHGRQPSAINVDYGAAKAALNNLTKALAEEFGPQGVRVNGVCPGPTRTPWWTDVGGAADILAEQLDTDRDSVLDRAAPEMMGLATGRLASPQEIADAVAWLASPRSASTIGAEFVVDAGWLKAA